MHAKKLLSLLLSALAAVTLLASCGSRWDYSREGVKAANEAQGETLRVEFQVDQKFTNALHDAVEENIQPADVEKAMLADASLKELLTSGYRLNVYALRADVGAEEVARTIAEEQILPRLSGCKDEGIISMVKADNNYFYEAVLTYKESSSGGGGGSEPGKPDDKPEEPVNQYTVTVVTLPEGEDLGTVTPSATEVEEGGEVTFTVEPNDDVTVVSITVNDETYDEEILTHTISNVQSDITITVVFEEKQEEFPVQWYETASKDGEYEAGTLIFREGASAVMGNKTLTLEATIKGLKAKQYAANPTAAENFSFQNVVHLIVEENSGVTEIPGYTTEEEYINTISTILSGGDCPETFMLSKKLESINLSGIGTVGLASFAACGQITNVVIKNSSDIQIGMSSFLGGFITQMPRLNNVTISSDGNLTIGNSAFYMSMSGSNNQATASLSGDTITIGDGAFMMSSSLTSLTMKGEIQSIGKNAFMPGTDTTSTISIRCTGGVDAFKAACPDPNDPTKVGLSSWEQVQAI